MTNINMTCVTCLLATLARPEILNLMFHNLISKSLTVFHKGSIKLIKTFMNIVKCYKYNILNTRLDEDINYV